jgi:hypothetical protein
VRVVLTSPTGDRYQLDTTEPELIGVWLKAWFDHWSGPAPRVPSTFTIEVSP